MSRLKAFAMCSVIALAGAFVAPNLQADEWNKKTILTVNEPLQIPNVTLQPGKYVMKLLDSQSDRHIVQVFDENEQHLITTILAIPNYRLQPTGDTRFGFWETPAGQPKALRSWFFPGDNFGQEFAYPKNEAMTLASQVHQQVPTTTAESTDLNKGTIGRTDETGKMASNQPAPQPAPPPAPARTETAQNENANTADRAAAAPAPVPEPAPAPAPEPQPAPAPQAQAAPAPQPQTLPATASPYPLIALIGLVSLSGYALLKLAVKRS